MAKGDREKLISRRDFIKISAVTATATAVSLTGLQGMLEAEAAKKDQGPEPVYRTLGRTGLRVTVVSFGAMLTPEHEVIRAGLDRGINYIDTARVYMKGHNEETVGKAIAGIRDKVYLATKTKPASNSRKEIMDDVETSLSKLRTDHVDVIQIHNLTSRDRAFMPEVREAYLDLRKQGKVRYFGATTHTNQAEVINAIVDDKDRFFDTVLVGYNFTSPPELTEAIERAAKAGIGVIAMKTQAGGYKTEKLGPLSPHQAALKWVLQNTHISCAIPGMKDMAMLAEDIAVMKTLKMTKRDQEILERYGTAISPYYCRLCGACEPTCPGGVAISVINRSLMYAEGYHDMPLASATYRAIPVSLSAGACLECAGCVARCVNGLNIAEKMERARRLLA